MERSTYYDYINERLSTYSTAIENNGKLNVLNLHSHFENFYRDFLNLLFESKLKNLNTKEQNAEYFDLACEVTKTVVQVSATCTKAKIQSALSGGDSETFSGYKFYFMSLSKDASPLRADHMTYEKGKLIFDQAENILDVKQIMKLVKDLDIDRMEQAYNLVKKELGPRLDAPNLSSNLTKVVQLLASLDLREENNSLTIDPFQIADKISYNELGAVNDTIKDFAIYFAKMDGIYSDFDNAGVNKSTAVLSAIRKEYTNNKSKYDNINLFRKIKEGVKNKIKTSSNFTEMSDEELDLCVDILVVDAFIRCKIFENPNNYSYAST